MMMKRSSLIRRDIDFDDIMVKKLKEMLISQNVINTKVAHRYEGHKGIAVMVANTSQQKSSKGIITTTEKMDHIAEDCWSKKKSKESNVVTSNQRRIMMKNEKLRHQWLSKNRN